MSNVVDLAEYRLRAVHYRCPQCSGVMQPCETRNGPALACFPVWLGGAEIGTTKETTAMTDKANQEPMDEDEQLALAALLEASRAMWSVAARAVQAADPGELVRLREATSAEQCQISVTMLLPSGAVRVGIVGAWAGDKTLYEMTPDGPVFERKLDS